MTAKKKTSSQLHAQLKGISKQAKDGLFEMLVLVDQIMSDHEYVDQFGGEGPLIDHFESNEFSHFGGTPSMSQMLQAYRHNPKKAMWQEHDYNIWALIELATPAKERRGKTQINWKARAIEAEAQVGVLEAVIEDSKKTVEELRNKVTELSSDNGELRGRVKTLEDFMAMQPVGHLAIQNHSHRP